MNKQRESVYTLRREVLEGKVHLTEEEVVDTRAYLLALAEDLLDDQVERLRGKAAGRRGLGSPGVGPGGVARLRVRSTDRSRRST